MRLVRRSTPTTLLFLAIVASSACAPSGEPGGELTVTPSICDPGNAGITLPEGFCAVLVIEELPGARHLAVAENGDVFVALRNRRSGRDSPVLTGGVAVLRDLDGDARADTVARWGVNGGNEVLLGDGYVLHAPDDAVLRYPFEAGALVPSGPPDTLVSALPADRNHAAKSVALGPQDALYVNIGAPSNACMVRSRTTGSPGQDPCPELETRGGIWAFDATATGQQQADGVRFATGLRHVVALATNPADGVLYGVVHGRDQLHDLFPSLFTVDQSTEKPSEELVRIEQGSDFGWPYCYHDPESGLKVLAPEYGGDGGAVGRCAEKAMPIVGFPAHWAPNDIEFYDGTQFPEHYRGGAFIAFHGSWNRAPNPQDGYRVVFVPEQAGTLGSHWEIFADGFRKEGVLARGETARPTGVAVGPDGSLYIADSLNGRIWKVLYHGS